jgi:hypothetical protein
MRGILALAAWALLPAWAVALEPTPAAPAPSAVEPEPPVAEHYSIDYRLVPERSRLEARAAVTVRNEGAAPLAEVPFLPYRLLEVDGAEGEDGSPLAFRQRVVRMDDHERFQVNAIHVTLPRPLAPGAATTLTLRYAGPFLGAAEVWPYVHDRVGRDYSLLRVDAVPYPLPSGTDRLRVWPASFTFDLRVTVPDEWVVVAGAEPAGTRTDGDETTYAFRSLSPTWRIDVAAGDYGTLTDPASGMTVHHLGEDDGGAARVLEAMRDAAALFARLFGDPPRPAGYLAIEVPDGWGSQAGDGYFLQTSAAFRDPAHLHELYHEIAHTWNAVPDPALQQTRWFDEAFASYFEALALRELDGPEAFQRRMDGYRRSFVRRAAADPRARETPVVRYGDQGLGGLSYTKGAWSLHVLHEAVGDDAFRRIIRAFLARHAREPADFAAFQRIAEEGAGHPLDRFFDEWIHGTASSGLLEEGLSAGEMAARYRDG